MIKTTSPVTALSLLLSFYSVFEIKFAKNNHTSRLLYGVFFQNGDDLGKNLRILLNSWHFTFEDKVKKSQIQTTNSIHNVDIQIIPELQLHSRATTMETASSFTTSNIGVGENESPKSPQSMPLIIADIEEQQPHDNSLVQIDEPEKMDVIIETASSSVVPSGIKQKSNTKKKFSNSSNVQHTVLNNATNSEASTAAIKNKKRKLPPSPKQRKVSSRLAAKRSRQNVSSFELDSENFIV